MIIENRWFILQGPRRIDLSGRPIGFLFIWLGGKGRPDVKARFSPIAKPREFGFYLPLSPMVFDRWRKIERFECHQLVEEERAFPHDSHEWPFKYQKAAQTAAVRELDKHSPRYHVKKIRSFCDRRADLASSPLQLTYEMILKKAA
jgi:hypothetical protein